MLNVQKIRLRFIFARALYLWRLFSKKLTVKGFSERTGMSVKLSSSEFACKLVAHKCTRMYIRGRGCPWFYSVAMFLRRKNPSSERPRTGGILIRSEFCIKLVFSRHTRKYVGKKCTRMYTSGQAICKKANGERLFRTDRDVGGSNQQRCFCGAKTRVQKLTRRSIFERAMDGGGSQQ